MKDICIIPTHERPEFLWLTLEKIQAAVSRENIEFWICEDVHEEKSSQLQDEIAYVVNHAAAILGAKHFQTWHTNQGSSYNVLTSFQKACDTDAKFVFFIEDDVRVTKDFFRFCYAAQEEFNPFFVTGNCPTNVKNRRPESVFLSGTWGQTFAMCFQRTKLQDMLKPDYSDYAILPTAEWDNYLLRHMLHTGQFCACACLQRGYHFGFHSYHAGKSFLTGDLQQRISQTRAILENPQAAGLEKNAYQVSQLGVSFPTTDPQWTTLRKAGSTVRHLNA